MKPASINTAEARNRLDADVRTLVQRRNVGKALIQKREHDIAPEWHGKIHRTRLGKRI
jgi:hypothetical protein